MGVPQIPLFGYSDPYNLSSPSSAYNTLIWDPKGMFQLHTRWADLCRGPLVIQVHYDRYEYGYNSQTGSCWISKYPKP